MPFCAPQIVASASFSQSTPLSETIYTPSAIGVFRISLQFGAVASGFESVWETKLTYTSAYTGNVEIADLADNTQSGSNDLSTVTWTLAAGSPITVVTDLFAGTASAYNIFVIVEQLA